MVKFVRLLVQPIDKNQQEEYLFSKLNSGLIVLIKESLDGNGCTNVKRSFMDKVMCEAIVYL
jgi:hypothetical protein